MSFYGNAPLKNRPDRSTAPKKSFRNRGSPWTAKSVWLAAGLFIGAGSAIVSDPAENSTISWFQSNALTIMTMTACFLGGFFIVWWARRVIIMTTVIIAALLTVVGLFIAVEGSDSEIKVWINSVNVWVRKYVKGAKHDLISLLPFATAAGVGGVLGFRKK
jgi:uncharacterized membrane protein (Fun14 family)